jgi:hypothetical protein
VHGRSTRSLRCIGAPPRDSTMIQVLRVSALYFAGVFVAGFVLGAVRTLWVVPALGTRAAELIEAPIMLLVVTLAARAVVRRHTQLAQWWQWLTVGLVALALLLAVEFTVVLRLRDLSLSEYFASRDQLSGAVYVVLLCIFAVMPLVMFRRRNANAA